MGAKIHLFLSQKDYKNPEGPTGVFRYTENTQLPFFPWMMHPTKLTNFLTMPEDWRIGRAPWFEMFSIKELLFKGARTEDEDCTLLVDVAGALGTISKPSKIASRTTPGYRTFLLSLMVSKGFTQIS